MADPTRTDSHSGSGRGADVIDRWSQPPPQVRRAGWSWLPSVFVMFSLLTLLAVPALLERRIAAVRSDALEPAQDARSAINDVRHALSEAEASLRGYLLTRDERLREALLAAHADEASAFEDLEPHARRLGPELVEWIQRLRQRSEDARRQRLDALDASPAAAVVVVDAHAELLAEWAAVRTAIVSRVEASRARIRGLERTGVLSMMALGALALTAALLVVVIAHRDRRRARLEGELRAAAMSLAEATEVEDILGRIVASAARTASGASSFVERIDEERGDVYVVTSAGEHVLPAGARVPFPGSLTEAALRSGEPEEFQVASMPDRPSAAGLKKVCGDCSGVVVPLISDRDPQGALVLLRRGRKGFQSRELLQLRIFGVFAALALRKGVLLAQAIEQQDALARAARSRERMVRGFSHDLKNPLGAADGHAALFEAQILGELEPRQQEHVQRIRGSLRSALEIIDDVVELARAEAGQLAVERVQVDAGALVGDAVREYEAAATAAGLELECVLPDALPPIVTDPRRVRQILGNLASNAIKYTPAGGRVRISAAITEGRRARDPGRWLTIGVEDTGPGIAAADMPKLFQEFQRLDATGSPGAGLGLAISERIARLLGGEIRVNSALGRGSTFTLWLPCEREDTLAAD